MPTLMARETAEIPDAVARLNGGEARAAIAAIARAFRKADPAVVLTVARGSSDHALLHLKYAAELTLGVPVASIGPSIASVHDGTLRAERAVVVAASQSGASADLVALTEALAPRAAASVGLLNTVPSSLADALGTTGGTALDVAAGPERAVAATKSCLNTMLAALRLVAEWAGDGALNDALDAAPGRLRAALGADVGEVEALLAGEGSHDARPVFVIGRGATMAPALEAGLKIMEVLRRPALAYSAAEVLHGPAALVDEGTPVLSFGGPGTEAAHERLAAQGARLIDLARTVPGGVAGTEGTGPDGAGGHALLDGPVRLAAFYRAVERAARARGLDPDAPPHLTKETVTV